MKITSATNLQWGNAEHTIVNMNVTFEHTGLEVLPFTANQNDSAQHGKDIFNRAVSGEWGTIAEYTEPVDTRTYATKRQAVYPDFKEYLDGIVKGDQAQIDKYIADCQAVKAKYPKPTE